MSYICAEDTTPCTGKRGCRHKGRWEHYMIHNRLWAKARMTAGFLCIKCLEKRIGRPLRPRDFTRRLVNEPSDWDTPLLAARKAGM